jgi:hypothetical protein
VDSWLRSPALDNLEEFNLHCPRQHQVMLPVLSEPFFRFSKTLIVATIERCHLSDNTVQGLQQGRSSPLGKVWQLPYLDFLQKIAYMYASIDIQSVLYKFCPFLVLLCCCR